MPTQQSRNETGKIHVNHIPDWLYKKEAAIKVGLSKNGALLICHTEKGERPVFFHNLMSKINESSIRKLRLKLFLRLTYKNAEVVGIDESIYIPKPAKIVECKGDDFCVDIERHKKFGRVFSLDFLEREIISQSQGRPDEGLPLLWLYPTIFRVQML